MLVNLRASVTSLLLAVLLMGCTTSSGGSQTATIGPSGGKIVSADGVVEMTVPANALKSTITVSIKPSNVAGAIGSAYEIEPSGTSFAIPVTMTFHYEHLPLAGLTPDRLVAATYGSNWTALDGYELNAAAGTVSGTTTHLSIFAAVGGCGVHTNNCGGCSIACSGATPVGQCSTCPAACVCIAGSTSSSSSSSGAGGGCHLMATMYCAACDLGCAAGQTPVCMSGVDGPSSCMTPTVCMCQDGSSTGSGNASSGSSHGG